MSKSKMNPRIRSKWIRALRSGKYVQGTGGLSQDVLDEADKPTGQRTFCCLGVLCDIAVKEGVIQSWQNPGGEYLYGNKRGHSSRDFLPTAVRMWANISADDPEVSLPSEALRTLSYLNDDGRSFAEIATLIQKNL